MPRITFVDHLPDLIDPHDADAHRADPRGRRVRLQVRVTESGIEILGDSMRPEPLDNLLEALDPDEIQHTLCG